MTDERLGEILDYREDCITIFSQLFEGVPFKVTDETTGEEFHFETITEALRFIDRHGKGHKEEEE